MTRVGQAEGIEHGTPRGARQHTRRRVLPVCGPCEEAIRVEREAQAREANTGKSARYNVGPKAKADRKDNKSAATRQVTAARELTPLERRRTARLLASRAHDAADLAALLDAVGVTAQDGKAALPQPTTSTTARSGDR